MELAFRESLKKMRGTKSKEKFSQELEMSRSNYSLIESGKSDPTLKTLERIAELTNSTLVIDLIPNELEQVELQIEEEKQWLSLIYWLYEITWYFWNRANEKPWGKSQMRHLMVLYCLKIYMSEFEKFI